MNMGVRTRTKINLTDVRISAAARCLKHSSDSPVDADFPNHSRQSSTSDRLESIRSVGSLAWDDTTLAWGDQTFNTNER